MLKKAVILTLIQLSLLSGAFAQFIHIQTYYNDDSSRIKESYMVLENNPKVLEGKYESFYNSGKIKSSGQYKRNAPEGIWTYYYENGRVKMTGTLKGKSSYGDWTYYYENGQKSMEGELKNNKRQGIWKMYYESGGIKSEGEFIDGEKTGIWNHNYEDGTLKAQAFYKGKFGLYKEYYSNGNTKMQGYNINGQSDSTWVYYYENGAKQADGTFREGKRSGYWTYYHENGNKSAYGLFVNGAKNGAWTYYHENGKISSAGEEKEGKKEGQWHIYDTSGQLKGEGLFESGSGVYKEYHENGNLKVSGRMENGVYEGLWMYYYENGLKEGECLFRNGVGTYTGYYPNGTVKMKGEINDGKNVGRWELYKEDGSVAGYYKPIYEDDKPVFKIDNKQTIALDTGDYEKPAYRYRKKNNRYFDPVINEFKGIILATNPLAVVVGSLPVSLEYYFQERLGHEIQFNLLRDPFFSNFNSIQPNVLYNQGFDIALRQKLYHPDKGIGMFYFANELRYTFNNHYFNAIDSLAPSPAQTNKVNATENKIEYSFIVGNRWIKLFGDRMRRNSKQNGITVDVFLGVGIGYRNFDKKYESNESYDEIFDELRQGKFSIVPRFGVNIGYIF